MADYYKCLDCGTVFRAEDAITVSECVGEFWGAPAYEDWSGCPHCKSTDLEEYKSTICWVSYYLNDGSQRGATLTVNGSDPDSLYDEIKEQLIKEHGEDFGGIADYGDYREVREC